MQQERDTQPGNPGAPGSSKKRRFSRTSRACSECRARKIRCNGRQPCEPCEDFERHCTLTSTAGQKVAGAPRTKILEDRLRRARHLIRKLQAQNPALLPAAEVAGIFDSPPVSPSPASDTASGVTVGGQGGYLEDMMIGKGLLPLDQGSGVYYGATSGLCFLYDTLQLFPPNSPQHGSVSPERPHHVLLRLFESPPWDPQGLQIDLLSSQHLPSQQTALDLLDTYFGNVYPLFQFMHEPTVRQYVDRIYHLDLLDLEDLDHDFLPLFHSVMALGYLFDQTTHQTYGCKGARDQAMRHFIFARGMIELDRDRGILGLQALTCLALFLISTSRLASAQTLIALAVSACMRMGLHLQTSCSGLTPLSREVRIRTFWTVVKLDLYNSGALGQPLLMDLRHVDQIKPSGLSRGYCNEENGGVSSATSRRILAASAQYLELLIISRKGVGKLYPKTDQEAGMVNVSKMFPVSETTMDEIKEELKAWREGLADALGPAEGTDATRSVTYELEMVHHYEQALLYRPFLHYLAKTKDESPPDARLLYCATLCVQISRLTIIRSEELLSQGLLAPASWQLTYIVFLSIVTLFYFLATQHEHREYTAIQKEAERGIRVLHATSYLDAGSRRCLDVLRMLIGKQSHSVHLDVDRLRPSLPLRNSFQSGYAQ
ncbi:uncharacterized protein A1O9_13059 [Exophiala aquamarina CBS 119918]|uniref:Zn(2)-C6 fungal-type domain-containing protein n=1 Tax=Exophiala aquamarina CBS 119918 TaxID=1182545 RepID=A0A072NSQ4_9EURO|nr:uncharacterized protein A1O9_13059 [Exophiala aquamarina CBS 119918]KEF50889.1 hypothetical protein A1O9_13059 [Exophiala aquamarina CBS 119918]